MKSTNSPPAVYTTGQIAKILKCAPRTVSKWFDTGRLKGYRIPGREWSLGWPIMWSAARPLAMDRFREWLRSHGEF